MLNGRGLLKEETAVISSVAATCDDRFGSVETIMLVFACCCGRVMLRPRPLGVSSYFLFVSIFLGFLYTFSGRVDNFDFSLREKIAS